MEEVRAWEETIVIPTYEIGAPDRNPMFLEKRVYQGSSGKVYPYPTTEKISHEKKDKHKNRPAIQSSLAGKPVYPCDDSAGTGRTHSESI